MMRCTKTT